MKKIIISLIAFIFLPESFLFSQSFTWGNTFTASSNLNPISVKVDALGNVYTMGYFNGTADFDPGPGTFTFSTSSGADVFVTKLSPGGSFVWAKRVTGGNQEVPQQMILDASGNIYVCGYFYATADFDPGPLTFNMTSAGGMDAFIFKLDVNGNFLWAKRYGAASDESCNTVCLDPSSGDLLTSGYFMSPTVDFDPGPGVSNLNTGGTTSGFFTKLDANGNFIWARAVVGSGFVYPLKSAIDASGNICVVGYFRFTNDFDPGPGTFTLGVANLNPDVFVLKLDGLGNFAWAKQMGSVNDADYGNQIVVDASANVYVGGTFSNTVDFDPGPGTFNLTSAGFTDVFYQKLDAGGNFIWAKRIGGTSGEQVLGMTISSSGHLFSTGNFAATVDFDPGPGTFNLSSIGVIDAFISKLDLNGNFSNANALGSATGNENGMGIEVDAALNIHACGQFSGNMDVDPGPGVYTLTGSIVSYNIKWAGCVGAPATPGAISGNVTACQGAANMYSVAPVGGAGSYTWTLPGGWSGTSSTNSISATPGTSGTMSVTASNGCGTSAAATLSVTVNPSPTISVNSGSICSGQSFTMAPSGAASYTFQGGNAVVSPTANSSYTVIGTNSLGCVSTTFAISNVTVNVNPTITVNSGSICSGNSFTMIPGGASTYTFQGGSSVVSPTANSSYTVVGTSTAGCVSQGFATSNVTVNASPTISVNSGSICSGQSFTIVPSGANTYTYQGGSAVVSPTSNASYTVSGTSTAGCVSASTATSNITVNATPTISVAGGAICPGGSFTLNPGGANTYTYSGGQVVSPTVTTNYSVSGTSTAGCVSQVAVVTITVVNNLTVTISGNNTVCSGSPINLTAGGAATYTWNTGAQTSTIAPTPTTNTTYSVLGTSGSCSNTAQISVTVNPLPTLTLSTSNPTGICIGQTATLQVIGANTYSWSTGPITGTIAVSPTTTTVYTVTGTNANGCSSTSLITQTVIICTGLREAMENGLTCIIYPNPFNNKITILVPGAVKKNLQIFNSAGTLLHALEISKAETEIDLENYAAGVYFIRIDSLSRRIIKE